MHMRLFCGQDMALSYGYTTAQEGRAMQNHEMLAQAAEDNKLKLDVVTVRGVQIATMVMQVMSDFPVS